MINNMSDFPVSSQKNSEIITRIMYVNFTVFVNTNNFVVFRYFKPNIKKKNSGTNYYEN